MQPGLDRAERPTETFRYLLPRQIAPEAQHDHDPLVRREGFERIAGLVSVEGFAKRVARLELPAGLEINDLDQYM